MKEAIKNIQWKNNIIATAVVAVLTFIYYVAVDVVDHKNHK